MIADIGLIFGVYAIAQLLGHLVPRQEHALWYSVVSVLAAGFIAIVTLDILLQSAMALMRQ